MTGNKRIFEQALRRGHNLAWDRRWNEAIREYEDALAEFPDDAAVHNSLGLAYLEAGYHNKAIQAYTEANRLSPDDPSPLNRIIDIQTAQGDVEGAAATCMVLADLYQKRGVFGQALRTWQQAIDLDANCLPARERQADAYVRLNQVPRAVREYLSIAQLSKEQGLAVKAREMCEKALQLDPENAQAQAMREVLLRLEQEATPVEQQVTADEGTSPADLAQGQALQELAGIPFEEQPIERTVDREPFMEPADRLTRPPLDRHAIDTLITQAIDFQTRGLLDEAIECYRKAIAAGIDRPAAHFNLGLLLQQRLRFREAIESLSASVHHSPYALGSHFALGECFKALGRPDEALGHFLQAVKIVDIGTVQHAEADDLLQLYDALAQSYAAKGDRETALEFINSLVDFFSGKGWEDKARTARGRLDQLSENGVTMSLAEMLAIPNAEAIFTAMALSQEYMKRGLESAATDICLRGIAQAPAYLPLHVRLAEILTGLGRMEEAVSKYEMVAHVYTVRNEPQQTVGVYRRLLRLSPLDVVIRSRLIDLLLSSGEIDGALDQYMELADAYYQLMQIPKAIEKYKEALRLVPRASDPSRWREQILRRLTDLQLRTGDWTAAASTLAALVGLCPEDERARLSLIDVYYKTGRDRQADRQTEALVERHRSQGDHHQAISLLEEAVRRQPQQMALHGRLARAYIDAGMRKEAVQELDLLGEMQLEAGLHSQAITTLKAIIALKPRNVDAYQQLLEQIGG